MQSLISIIVPAYNVSKYIARAIESVQKQSYSNWELIIINDGSKDNTEEVVKPYLKDPRISIYSQPNAGVCKARNNGLYKAKGEYLVLLDADDEFQPENLKAKISSLQKNPQADWVYSNLVLIDENSGILKPSTKGKGENVLENILLWNGEVVPGPCSNLVFRSVLLSNGLAFDPEFSTAADQDFCLQLSGTSAPVFLPEPLACYRILENSMSRNVAVMEKDHIGVYRKAEKNNLFHSNSFKRECFANLYMILAGSWWVDGKNKKRAFFFMWKCVTTRPLHFFRLMRKLF